MTPPATPWPHRAAASLLALLITGLGMRALLADITLRSAPPIRSPVVYVQSPLVTLPPSAAAPARPAEPAAPPNPALPRIEATSRAAASPRRSSHGRSAPSAAPREPVINAITVPAADAAASAPPSDVNERRALDLSTDVMRAAARDSRSTVRRMVDASGRALGDEPRSRAESMASSVAGAGKPDCLGPNEGGSLLSIIVIPYQVLRDQCR